MSQTAFLYTFHRLYVARIFTGGKLQKMRVCVEGAWVVGELRVRGEGRGDQERKKAKTIKQKRSVQVR